MQKTTTHPDHEMDRIKQAQTSGHAKQKWTPLPDYQIAQEIQPNIDRWIDRQINSIRYNPQYERTLPQWGRSRRWGPTEKSDIIKTRKRRRACSLTKSVYTPRTLFAAHSHIDQPTSALAADTVNPNATGMSAEQTRPDNRIA